MLVVYNSFLLRVLPFSLYFLRLSLFHLYIIMENGVHTHVHILHINSFIVKHFAPCRVVYSLWWFYECVFSKYRRFYRNYYSVYIQENERCLWGSAWCLLILSSFAVTFMLEWVHIFMYRVIGLWVIRHWKSVIRSRFFCFCAASCVRVICLLLCIINLVRNFHEWF